MRDNITKSYKQARAQTYTDINNAAKDKAHSLELSDRMNCLARKEAFITLRDHKENAIPCRLINPAKSEMGRVSNAVLDRILQAVDQKLHLNMWRNTAAVTEWFTKIDRKEKATFFCFDVVDFYPSITEDLLKRALLFAKQYTTISDQENDIILHSRKSMLFTQDKEWIKKGTGLFDVTMGCYDGAEICQLVGTFVLATITKATPTASIGPVQGRWPWCAVDTPGSKADRIRKDLIKMFEENGSENYDSNQLKGGRLPRRDTPSVHKELLSIQDAKRSPNLHTQAVKPPTQHHQKSTSINQPPSHGHIEWQRILRRRQAPVRQRAEGKRVLWRSRISRRTEERCERVAEEPTTEDHMVQPSI